MPLLTDVIHIIPPDGDDEVEDIFASAAGLIFTDDTRTIHGDPGSVIVYRSDLFGDIQLQTADPEGEDERRLFSHYLWNAGIKMAQLVGTREDTAWSVRGRTILELGSGMSV